MPYKPLSLEVLKTQRALEKRIVAAPEQPEQKDASVPREALDQLAKTVPAETPTPMVVPVDTSGMRYSERRHNGPTVMRFSPHRIMRQLQELKRPGR